MFISSTSEKTPLLISLGEVATYSAVVGFAGLFLPLTNETQYSHIGIVSCVGFYTRGAMQLELCGLQIEHSLSVTNSTEKQPVYMYKQYNGLYLSC